MTYTIDFSDPLNGSFQIDTGNYDGPGSTSSHSTLRLYGRNALEWGEAVDEDLLRLVENFASASPPSSPVGGQVWVECKLYYRDLSLGNVVAGWYFYDPSSLLTNKWTLLNGTGVVANAPDPSPTQGQYYYDSLAGSLKRYDSLGKYEPLTWLPRSSFEGIGAPISPAVTPLQAFRVYNEGTAMWVNIAASQNAVVSPTAPTPPTVGLLWYDTTTGNLKVWTGTTWQHLLGPTNLGGTSVASGIVDMSMYRIINVMDPILPQDVATKHYVDALVGANSGGAMIDGPTSLVVSTSGTYTITDYDAFTTYTLSAVSGSVTRTGATITYTAPPTVVPGGFIINGRTIPITITNPVTIYTPTLSLTATTVIAGQPLNYSVTAGPPLTSVTRRVKDSSSAVVSTGTISLDNAGNYSGSVTTPTTVGNYTLELTFDASYAYSAGNVLSRAFTAGANNFKTLLRLQSLGNDVQLLVNGGAYNVANGWGIPNAAFTCQTRDNVSGSGYGTYTGTTDANGVAVVSLPKPTADGTYRLDNFTFTDFPPRPENVGRLYRMYGSNPIQGYSWQIEFTINHCAGAFNGVWFEGSGAYVGQPFTITAHGVTAGTPYSINLYRMNGDPGYFDEFITTLSGTAVGSTVTFTYTPGGGGTRYQDVSGGHPVVGGVQVMRVDTITNGTTGCFVGNYNGQTTDLLGFTVHD